MPSAAAELNTVSEAVAAGGGRPTAAPVVVAAAPCSPGRVMTALCDMTGRPREAEGFLGLKKMLLPPIPPMRAGRLTAGAATVAGFAIGAGAAVAAGDGMGGIPKRELNALLCCFSAVADVDCDVAAAAKPHPGPASGGALLPQAVVKVVTGTAAGVAAGEDGCCCVDCG